MDEILEFEGEHKFDIEWTNRGPTFAQRIAQMYENKEQFDLIIKHRRGKQLMAHRHVMAIFSPYIKGILEENLNAKGNFVDGVSEGKFSVHLNKNQLQIGQIYPHFMRKVCFNCKFIVFLIFHSFKIQLICQIFRTPSCKKCWNSFTTDRPKSANMK